MQLIIVTYVVTGAMFQHCVFALNGECPLVPFLPTLCTIDDVAYCTKNIVLFLVSIPTCYIIIIGALSIIIHHDPICILWLYMFLFHLIMGIYSSWLPTMVYCSADTFGVPILPSVVYHSAATCGVPILPSVVHSIAHAFGVPLLPSKSMVYIIASVFGISILFLILLQKLSPLLPRAKCISNGKTLVLGGHRTRVMKYDEISAFITDDMMKNYPGIETNEFYYIAYVHKDVVVQYSAECYLKLVLPMNKLVAFIPITEGRQLAKMHGIQPGARATIAQLKLLFEQHVCDICSTHVTIISVQPSFKLRMQRSQKNYIESKTDEKKQLTCEQTQLRVAKHRSVKKDMNFDTCDLASVFPPCPVDRILSHKIIDTACSKLTPESFEEKGCAVCGQLVPISLLSRLSAVKSYLHILEAPGFTRQERHKVSHKIREYPLAIDNSCQQICNSCRAALRSGNIPKKALARGLWLGQVPEVLLTLRYVEKMLIARVRHSCCSIRVASGMRKMKAHAISYQQPLPKIYNILPPPKVDIEDVLAIMFTGPSKPTSSDFQRTPFLVRRNHVKLALEWLILNHADYHDVSISMENLAEYPEDMPPVGIEYKQMMHNKTPEGTSVHDIEEEDGTENGQCAFTVHGLTGEDLNIMSTNAVKLKALQHLNSQGKFLAIGHSKDPESIWHNAQLYPQMFPWLFPYGLGGVGTVKGLSDKEHKKLLLMYHDKRFQTDHDFPFIAFSHEQIKTASSQSFLLADKAIFNDIKQRILTLDNGVLKSLLQRMSKDEIVKPESEQEEQCFKLIRDLDHIAGPVKGSNTSKKWMRNEIWSLIHHRGAPFWYITISPADVKHPLCIYFADKKEKFNVEILPYDERMRLICRNPVAGARFFDFLVNLFITDILGFDSKHAGLYGDANAYYGTVEQQGRLTLHLHMLIWLKGNLTPQEMRERILDQSSNWQKQLISWLESCQTGQFMTGTQEEVLASVAGCLKDESYKDPTETLPQLPPPLCNTKHAKNESCGKCDDISKWWKYFANVVDDLVSRSNIHNCERGTNKDGSASKRYVSCKDNKFGKCKARFPRPIFEHTEVDPETGGLNIRKHEAWINFFTPVLTYIMRCNTDVTCMWSGTALKAVIVYVSDYITKTGLKTHVVFEAIRSVFDKHHDIIGSSLSEKEKARKLMNKIVNALSIKTEMGAPMVCMYLLGNPDHYTNHTFIPFYWHAFVLEAQRPWEEVDQSAEADKVTLIKTQKQIVGFSPVHDYIYRPSEFAKMGLYQWVLQCERRKYNQKGSKHESDAEPSGGEKVSDTHLHKDIKVTNVEGDSSEDITLNNSMELNDDDEPAYSDISDTETLQENAIPTKLPKNMQRFQKKHPLYDTHIAILKPLKPTAVVNFIGRILPRCDQGDREHYCLTMLVLFKPWRTGLNLKAKGKSWDETFNEHEFSKREMQLMRNFNIKYECYDARDDFRARLKEGSSPNEWIMNCFDSNDADDDLNDIQDPYVDPNSEDLLKELNNKKLCASELNRQKEAKEIRDVLQRTGWLDESVEIMPYTDSAQVKDTSHLPPASWKAIVQAKKHCTLENKMTSTSKSKHPDLESFKPDVVKVIDKAYLEKRFHTTKHNNAIGAMCKEYSLNDEQERAFRIIANHVVIPNSEPLKMYIGGMGGTGKSQVLKALSSFFESRNEAYRFIIVAPTGTAAALLSGSTYHSVFGINEISNDAQTTKMLMQVRTRLLGVDYIFLDEVSMLSCHDMYKISAQLCKVMGEPAIPFGGLNMLFAGDFAQLPPPVGGESIALYSRTVGQSGTWKKAQEMSMGRALWHQVNTVVILRQNMRQKTQSIDDDKLRNALENMRYKDCSLADIQFLRSHITSQLPGRPSITDPDFRSVSIITAKNAQKDEINRLGCQLFAQHTGQQLIDFYSEDTLKPSENLEKRNKVGKMARKRLTKLDIANQKILWNLSHSSASKPVPGKLSICMGLPIMIKSNVATELCITNGQEATVVGWQSTVGQHKQQMLDVLFVKLKAPPKSVQIDGLAENIVPLTRTSAYMTCNLPDGGKVSISRSQVEVLPNFAMTDFASQGKTRPKNPVDLNNCRSHQAYYTALSRSSTAKGTIILQGFDPKKITGRASGALRQEFRDLELLDEITKLQYLGKLPCSVTGDRRNSLIHSFRLHKGMGYVPCTVHCAIKWSKKDPMLDPIADDLLWNVVTKEQMPGPKPKNIPHTPLKSSKRKEITPEKEHRTKITKKNSKSKSNANPHSEPNINVQFLMPIGTEWSQNSCAYDSVLCILHSIWSSDTNTYTDLFRNLNDILGNLALGFTAHASGSKTLESARDDTRRLLHTLAPSHFRWGQYASVPTLIDYLLTMPTTTTQSDFICKNGHISTRRRTNNTCCLLAIGSTMSGSVANWMKELKEESNLRCTSCTEKMAIQHQFLLPLPFIALDFSSQQLQIDHTFHMSINNNEYAYKLQGIIYYAHSHFTARVIQNNGMIWFYDGIATGQSLEYEGSIENFHESLNSCKGKPVTCAIYVKV